MPGVLAHRTLGFARGAGGEVDVGELVGATTMPRSSASCSSARRSSTTERLDTGQGVQGLVEVAALPASVSTSRHSARARVVAIRSAGKCGSMGR